MKFGGIKKKVRFRVLYISESTTRYDQLLCLVTYRLKLDTKYIRGENKTIQ